MTTDLTQPPAEMGAAPAIGQGPSHGHRRRRRRRKNKSSQQPGLPAQQSHPAQPAPQPQAQAAPPRPPQSHQNQGRKKKFFPKGQAQQGQPGNSVHAQGKRIIASHNLPAPIRVLAPDSMSTMDYRPDRLNIYVNEEGYIVSASYG